MVIVVYFIVAKYILGHIRATGKGCPSQLLGSIARILVFLVAADVTTFWSFGFPESQW
jgi:hypothetical protein